LAQAAVVESWRRRMHVRDAQRFAAFVRTVARRLRYHTVRRERLRRCLSLEHPSVGEVADVRDASPRKVRIGSRWVDAAWASAELERELRAFGALNGALLRSFYSGFSCAELADRYGLREASVRARLYRARMRLRRQLEERARLDAD